MLPNKFPNPFRPCVVSSRSKLTLQYCQQYVLGVDRVRRLTTNSPFFLFLRALDPVTGWVRGFLIASFDPMFSLDLVRWARRGPALGGG